GSRFSGSLSRTLESDVAGFLCVY
ncbi:hypothetical protein Tsp_15701, partial [Trichinella spiralis]